MTIKIIKPVEADEITKKIQKGREDSIANLVNEIITYYAQLGETSYTVPLTGIGDLSPYAPEIYTTIKYTFLNEDDVYMVRSLFLKAGYKANLTASFEGSKSLFFWKKKPPKKNYYIEVSRNG